MHCLIFSTWNKRHTHTVWNESMQQLSHTHTHTHTFWSNVCMTSRPTVRHVFVSAELSCSSVTSVWCVCFVPHTVKSKQQTTWIQRWLVQQREKEKKKKLRLINCVLGSVRVYSSHLAMWGDERQAVVGAKGPSHRSIPLSSDLRVYPAHHGDWGTSFSLIQPACTAPHLTSQAERMFMFSRILGGGIEGVQGGVGGSRGRKSTR